MTTLVVPERVGDLESPDPELIDWLDSLDELDEGDRLDAYYIGPVAGAPAFADLIPIDTVSGETWSWHPGKRARFDGFGYPVALDQHNRAWISLSFELPPGIR